MEFHDLIFIGEVVLQSKIAHRASERLEETSNTFDRIEVWCSIQSILVAAGNVSKILWPSHKYKIRGERLRQLLKVEENNLLSSRKFRNHFEHYDERIEEWFQSRSGGVYVDLAMNPSMSGLGNSHRGYNSLNNTLVFRGESFDLAEVLKALEEIYENCKPHVLTEIP
ncbi:hypothetical protein [Flavobacterium rhizosphaerae]|uniref:Uncharacterized protein n=1 Tax=Flavobacterium rhizosphaerae TaxID=3163298 RepID=A0ABW8YY27_9FLAO